MRVTIIGLLQAAAVLTAVFSLVTLFGIKHHLVELFTHFRLQYLLASVVLFAAFMWLRELPYAGVMFISAVISTWHIAPWYLMDRPEGGKTSIKLIHVNVHASNTSYQRVIDFIEDEDPDIVFVQEVSPEWAAELASLPGELHVFHVAPRDDNFGIALYSKLSLDKVTQVVSPPLGYPTIVASLIVDDAPVTFISTHPTIPIGATLFAARNEQLASVAELVAQTDGKIVFSGDMNASLWDPKLAEFEETTGLVNVRNGTGLLPSWPTFFPPAAIPIDHAMVSPGIGVVEVHTGRSVGSDHLPLVVTLTL